MVGLTERALDVGSDKPVAAIARRILLAQPRDPPLGQANADIDLASADGGDHVAGPRGERHELGIEAEVGFGEVEGR